MWTCLWPPLHCPDDWSIYNSGALITTHRTGTQKKSVYRIQVVFIERFHYKIQLRWNQKLTAKDSTPFWFWRLKTWKRYPTWESITIKARGSSPTLSTVSLCSVSPYITSDVSKSVKPRTEHESMHNSETSETLNVTSQEGCTYPYVIVIITQSYIPMMRLFGN